MLPPLVHLFSRGGPILGIPGAVLYLFTLWAVLIVCARWLSRRLPEAGYEKADEESS